MDAEPSFPMFESDAPLIRHCGGCDASGTALAEDDAAAADAATADAAADADAAAAAAAAAAARGVRAATPRVFGRELPY